jgi:hypothetical protein
MSMKPQCCAREVPVFGQKWEGFGPSLERAWFDAARALPDAPFGDEAQQIPCGSFEVSPVVAARHTQLQCVIEAQLARQHALDADGLQHHPSDKVVGQQIANKKGVRFI